MKHVLVTGASGLLGMAIARKLHEQGHDVTGTFLDKAYPELNINWRPADLTCKQDCLNMVEGIDEIYHCAAQSYGAALMNSDPSLLVTNNLIMNALLLDAAAKNGVKKFLFVSSSTVYPNKIDAVKEEESNSFSDLYPLYEGVGGMKLYSEKMCKFYLHKYGLRTAIIRPANMYGPYDKFDEVHSHVIPNLIRRALLKETPFVVWGGQYTIRDFTFVDDVADIAIQVLNNYSCADPINISQGDEIVMKNLVHEILDACNHGLTKDFIEFDHSKPSAISYRVLDTTKARNLGFTTKFTPLKEGIRRTVEWYKKSQKL